MTLPLRQPFAPMEALSVDTIPVGEAPHGILYWPLPGTMSIGQNGNMR